MAYKSIFEEEIKPATTPKASTGYVSIFDNEEKKLEPIATQTVSNRYVQDPTRSNVSIPFEQADPKTQYESLTYDEIKKMKSSELVDLRRRAGIDKGDSKEWYSSFMAGIGDIMTTVGSTMKWKGAEGGLIDRIGENIQEAGKITQSKYTDYEALDKLGEFDWADLKDVSFWQNKAPRMLPFTMSLIPAAIIGGSLGATAGASFGLGALASTITGAVGSALLSRPLEGMSEAGSTYDEAIAKGFSEEESQKAANEVFVENLKQMSALDVIQMIPFVKNIKGFKIPSSTFNKIINITGPGTAIVSEGFEEVLQNRIVANALGEKFDLASPETKESFVLGTIMGGVFQGSGGIVNISQRAIANATKENLSKKNQAIFEKNLDKFMKEGETRSDSEALALNEVAKIDQKGLQDAITKTLDEKAQELKEAGIEQQASTVLKEETPADKLSKQIKKSDPIDRLLATIEEQEVETKAGEPLVQEARKYKSAEEFVKAQGTQVFRSSASPFDVAKMGNDGIFLSPDKKFVTRWMKSQGYKNFETFIISPEAKILTRENFPKKFIRQSKDGITYTSLDDQADVIKYAKENGFDGIEDYYMATKKHHTYKVGKKIEPEFAIWNKDVIKTKSQLTDIWNKAQEKPTIKKETPTIKKPTAKKEVKEAKPIIEKSKIEKPKTLTGYHVVRNLEAIKKIEEEGFSLEKFGSESGTEGLGDPKGIYFFSDKKAIKELEGWSDVATSKNTLERTLNLEKPYIVKSEQQYFDDLVKPAVDTTAKTLEEFRETTKKGDSEKISKYALEKGYDGILDKEGILSFDEPQIIVLDLKKIEKPAPIEKIKIKEVKPTKALKEEKITTENFSKHYERIKGEFGYEQSSVLFETISTKDQVKRAFEYINRFPKQALQIAYGLREAPASIKAIAIRQSLAVSLREKGEIAKASEIAKMVSRELTEAAQTLNLAKTDLGIKEETAIMNSIEQSRIESIGEKLGKIKDGDIKEAVRKEIRRKTEKATKEVVESQSKKTDKVMSEIDSLVNNIICK